MSAKKSIVEQLVERLPPQEKGKFKLTKRVKEKTQEHLRILATKVGYGLLGKGDTENARAAAILEFVVRRQTQRHKFSPEALAAIAGTKKNVFQQLQRKVENYLSDTVMTSSSKRKGKRLLPLQRSDGSKRLKVNDAATAVPAPSTTTTNATTTSRLSLEEDEEEDTEPPTDTFLDLALRLGSLIPDSHGFTTRAKQLLVDITKVIHTSKPHLRQASLDDLRRHRSAYEAACFYVVAKASTTSIKRKRSTHRRSQQDTEDDENDNAEEEEEQEQNQLDVKDVIRVSNVSERVFRDVLPTVEELAAQAVLGQTKPAVATRNQGAATEQQTPPAEQPVVYSDAFLKWKEEVLSKARNNAKTAISIQSNVRKQDIQILRPRNTRPMASFDFTGSFLSDTTVVKAFAQVKICKRVLDVS